MAEALAAGITLGKQPRTSTFLNSRWLPLPRAQNSFIRWLLTRRNIHTITCLSTLAFYAHAHTHTRTYTHAHSHTEPLPREPPWSHLKDTHSSGLAHSRAVPDPWGRTESRFRRIQWPFPLPPPSCWNEIRYPITGTSAPSTGRQPEPQPCPHAPACLPASPRASLPPAVGDPRGEQVSRWGTHGGLQSQGSRCFLFHCTGFSCFKEIHQ